MTPTSSTHRAPTLVLRLQSGRSSARAGFTLLEIVIAVTIVAILAAVIVPRLTGFIGQAKSDRAKADASALAQTVELYMTKFHMSTLPSDFELDVLADGEPPMLKNRKQLNDPWGRPFAITIPGVANYDFDIVSYGEDGEAGTTDDIVNGQG